MVSAPHCLVCEQPLDVDHPELHLCKTHVAEDKAKYGELPPLQAGGEVVYLVQVKEFNEDHETWYQYYETGAVTESGDTIMRVEIYDGKKARVILSNEKQEPYIYCFPWHKVLHWQEA